MKITLILVMLVAFLGATSASVAHAEERPRGDEYHRKIDWWGFPNDHPCITSEIVLAVAIIAGLAVIAVRTAMIGPGSARWIAGSAAVSGPAFALDFRLRERGRASPPGGLVLLRF